MVAVAPTAVGASAKISAPQVVAVSIVWMQPPQAVNPPSAPKKAASQTVVASTVLGSAKHVPIAVIWAAVHRAALGGRSGVAVKPTGVCGEQPVAGPLEVVVPVVWLPLVWLPLWLVLEELLLLVELLGGVELLLLLVLVPVLVLLLFEELPQ